MSVSVINVTLPVVAVTAPEKARSKRSREENSFAYRKIREMA